MRRLVSILCVAIFALGPALATLPAQAFAQGNAESRLPACCRKNGAHHCAMSVARQSAGETGSAAGRPVTTVSAPSCCPCYPHTVAGSPGHEQAWLSSPTAAHLLPIAQLTVPASTASASLRRHHSWPRRGPPAFSLL